jgi:hypothetical protein
MLEITHLTDRSITVLDDESNFARWEFDMSILSLLGHQLTRSACASNDLPTLSDFQFDIVYQRARRYVSKGKSIAGLDVGRRTCNHLVSYPELIRSQDIAFLSIRIVKQGNPGGPIRVILNRSHMGRDLSFVTFEIDDPILFLVASPSVPGRDPAVAVPSSALLQRQEEAPLRGGGCDLSKRRDLLKPSGRRGGSVFFNRHLLLLQK